MYTISSIGISVDSEEKMKSQLNELIERGPLTEEEFNALQAEFNKSRNEKRDNATILKEYKETSKKARENSRYFTWLPWLFLSVLIVSLTPLEFALLMLLPVLLALIHIFTPVDIAIYAVALLLGNLIRRFWIKSKMPDK